MSEFYEPTVLFRQNAIRRSPYGLPVSSNSNLSIDEYKSKNSSWVYSQDSNNDTEILNKVCSLNRLNIKSNYWKIPDNNMDLTSMATKVNGDTGTLAISSGSKNSNLFIYELDLQENYLTHHNTISLPNIHSMKWVPNTSNLLMTGNNKGYGHLITVPELGNREESAEIVKRFNHRKHLRSINKDPNIFLHNSTIIEKMNFIDQNQLISIYDNNLFNWDLHDSTSSAKPKPINITSINGLKDFDKSHNSNILGVAGKFGVSLFDLRDPKFNVPKSSHMELNKSKLTSNLIKWCPTDENIFAAGHLDGVVRLWDIRMQDNFGSLKGHNGKVINTIEWVEGDIFSGGRDGNIIHWDLTTDIRDKSYDLANCGLKEGLHSIKFDPIQNKQEIIVDQRQCGTVLPASNTNIISLESIETSDDLKVLSIDGSSFFGLHSRIYDAVEITTPKLYYTNEDLELIKSSEDSHATLVDDQDDMLSNSGSINSYEMTKPLSISRKPTHYLSKSIEIISPPYATINDSHETLLDTPIENSKFEINLPHMDDVTNDSPISVQSDKSFATIDTVATSINEPAYKHNDFVPQHKYQISEIKFDNDDFVFNNPLMN